MKKIKKCCVHCHQTFFLTRNPAQQYCAARCCQNARKRVWRKQARLKDPTYDENQRRVNGMWRRRQTDYWRRYRESHPNYMQRNREQQKLRDRRRAQESMLSNASHLAKSDALETRKAAQITVPEGFYQLIPVMHSDLAKSDALTVKISVMT